MKNSKTDVPLSVRNWLAEIGRRGGENGSSADKRRAVRARWNKPGARKKKQTTNSKTK